MSTSRLVGPELVRLRAQELQQPRYSAAGAKRVREALREATRSCFDTALTMGPEGEDVMLWRATYIAPKGAGPYEGGVFFMEIRFPCEFPFKPPKCQLITPIYHPGWTADGTSRSTPAVRGAAAALTIYSLPSSLPLPPPAQVCRVCRSRSPTGPRPPLSTGWCRPSSRSWSTRRTMRHGPRSHRSFRRTERCLIRRHVSGLRNMPCERGGQWPSCSLFDWMIHWFPHSHSSFASIKLLPSGSPSVNSNDR
jgi:hypothetical protein